MCVDWFGFFVFLLPSELNEEISQSTVFLKIHWSDIMWSGFGPVTDIRLIFYYLYLDMYYHLVLVGMICGVV